MHSFPVSRYLPPASGRTDASLNPASRLSDAISQCSHVSNAALLLSAQARSPSSPIKSRSGFFTHLYHATSLSRLGRSMFCSLAFKIGLHSSRPFSECSTRSSVDGLYTIINNSSSIYCGKHGKAPSFSKIKAGKSHASVNPSSTQNPGCFISTLGAAKYPTTTPLFILARLKSRLDSTDLKNSADG